MIEDMEQTMTEAKEDLEVIMTIEGQVSEKAIMTRNGVMTIIYRKIEDSAIIATGVIERTLVTAAMDMV
jgi:hypothetical protein